MFKVGNDIFWQEKNKIIPAYQTFVYLLFENCESLIDRSHSCWFCVNISLLENEKQEQVFSDEPAGGKVNRIHNLEDNIKRKAGEIF